MRKKILFFILLVFFITGCGKLKGDFAFKRYNEDVYRKVSGPLEFEKKEKIHWVYVLKDVEGIYNIVISLVKKEIVWVDLTNRVEKVSKRNKIIYGKIENLSEGFYKIIISNMDQIIDEKEFVVFSEDGEYYNYDEQ